MQKKKEQKPLATKGIVDSQSVKITDRGGLHGYDGGKKVNGRKRHIIVDANGFLLDVLITEANYGDRKALEEMLEKPKQQVKKLKYIRADMGYRGKDFCDRIKARFDKNMVIMEKPRKYVWVHKDAPVPEIIEPKGFPLQKKRWIVERTFAWLGKFRRLSKDYEFNTRYSKGMIFLAMIKNMLRILAPT